MPPKKLHDAVKAGNLIDVKRHLRTENVNDPDQYQQTPLHVACQAEQTEIVKLLLRKRANVNAKERNGWTPLHCGAQCGSLDIIELLLAEEMIEVGELNKDGTSALHYLVRLTQQTPDQVERYKRLLRSYIAKRGDINSQSKHGEGAIHQACYRGNLTAVRFLIENGADINLRNKMNETGLHYAVRAGQKDIIQALIELGADVNIKSEDGTPFQLSPSPEITKLMEAAVAARESKRKDDSIELVDINDYILTVEVLRAQALIPIADKESANPFCQLGFGKQKFTTKVKQATLAPVWKEEFRFNIEDVTEQLKVQIFHQEANQMATRDDLLGSVSLALSSLQLTTDGTPVVQWYGLKRGRTKLKSRLRLKLCFVAKNQPPQSPRDDTEDSDSESSSSEPKPDPETIQNGAFGWARGECKEPGCDCDQYQQESARGGPCQNCGHFPAKHAKLEKQTPETPVVATATTTTTTSASTLALSTNDVSSSSSTDLSESMSARTLATAASWEVDATELKFVRLLGEGTSAKVFRGTYRNQDVAIKVLKGEADQKVLDEFKKEFDIMSTLRSPHVVFFFGACLHPSMCMVLEFCHKGALYDVLQTEKHEDISWYRVLRAAIDTVKGLLCLHSWKPPIVHRDLKTLNLLVDENYQVKVSDFGLSRFAAAEQTDNTGTLTKLRGTYAYCAPEVYFGQAYSAKADVFSFGIILWELAYRCLTRTYQQPYSEYKHIVFDFQIIIQTAKNDLRPTMPKNTPKIYADLVRQCWDSSPANRPDTPQLMEACQTLLREYQANQAEWDALIPATPTPEA